MLRDRLRQALNTALKERDENAVATLRLILAALKDRDIAARSSGNPDGIADDAILALLQTMIKQRRESIEFYERGNRPEMVIREEGEIEVIERFLPRQLNTDEIQTAVVSTLSELDAKSIKDMGRVMAALRANYAGQMDFSKASAVVKRELAAG